MKSRVLRLRASPATFHGLLDLEREIPEERDPDLILAFLPATPELQVTLDALAEVWSGSQRCGCETATQCADSELTQEGCLHFFWLDAVEHRFELHVVEGSDASPPDDAAVDGLIATLEGADSAILLIDGLRFPTEAFLERLRRRLGSRTPRLVGGLASQRRARPDGFGSRVFAGTTIHPSACLALISHGIEMDIELFRGWEAASPIYTVTRAAGHVVYEIDGEPTVDWYRRFFTVDGKLVPMPETAHRFPLIIDGPDPLRRQVYRRMKSFDEPEGAVAYWGEIAAGDQVRLGIANPSSVRGTLAQVSAQPAQAALLWGCTSRQVAHGDSEPEVAEIHRALGGNTPMAGFLSFAEIGPLPSGVPVFHNQTAVLALLRESGEPRP